MTVSTAVSKSIVVIKPKHTVNHFYLSMFALILSIASSIQVGFILAENGQIGFILAQKLGWEQTSFFNNIVLATTVASAGLAIGSQLGGVIGDRITLRNLMLLSNVLGIFANLIKIQEFTATILLGRFLIGVFGGLMNFCYGKALNETVP